MNSIIKKRIEEINSGRVPEGYKQTPFGIFPCDWIIESLGEVCDIYSGGTPSTKNNAYWDGDIPWCCPTDITKAGKYIEKTDRNISSLGLANSSATLMPVNSILMCSRATIGPRCINKIPMATNQGFKNLVCKDSGNIEFVYYLIEQLIANLKKASNGSTFLELSKTELENAKYCFPSQSEQGKIAEILMKWDEMVELQEQYITKLEIRKKAVMKKLLTPKDWWNKNKLNNISLKEKGKPVSIDVCGKTPIIDMAYLETGKFINYSNHGAVFASKDDILLLWDGASAGALLTNVEGVVGSTFVLLKITDKNIYRRYLYYWLKKENQKNNRLREGSGIPHMQKDYMKMQDVCFPDKLEQKKIADAILLIENNISLQKEKLDKIKTQRKILQQYLLTGIVRVV